MKQLKAVQETAQAIMGICDETKHFAQKLAEAPDVESAERAFRSLDQTIRDDDPFSQLQKLQKQMDQLPS